jgi:hypothetical protein
MVTDRSDAAEQRSHHLRMVELALVAGETDPYELRLGMFDALAGARWSLFIDPDDPDALRLLRVGAEFAVGVATSIGVPVPSAVPIDGAMRNVPGGLPREALTSSQWSEALWAATAAGDPVSAMWLAHVDTSVFPVDGSTAALGLAMTLAAFWRGSDGVGAALIDALEATDPAGVDRGAADALLDLVVPPLRVFRALLDPGDRTVESALDDASAAFVEHWQQPPDGLEIERHFSLPLAGLGRLAASLGAEPRPVAGAVPAQFLSSWPVADGCIICANPHAPFEERCRWCGADLTADASLALTPGQLLRPGWSCRSCRNENRFTALRCWECSAPPPEV